MCIKNKKVKSILHKKYKRSFTQLKGKNASKVFKNIKKIFNNCQKHQKSNILSIVSNIYSRKFLNNMGFSTTLDI